MNVICENCGREVIIPAGQDYVKCSCGYNVYGKNLLGDQKELYERAALFFRENEFDLAYREYGKILDNNSSDAAAHWGQFLCKYGIEYVIDPSTGKEIPTLHRNLPQSVLECPSYLLALEFAEEEQMIKYRKQAEEIRSIQGTIEATAKKQDPFDIFISYKEETEEERNGKTEKVRTVDSYRAQDIYRELTDMGYHVFYARETLAKRVGEEYEPIIYSALSTAKMMLVLGTKREYFTAAWVRNEWSRFLEFAEHDRTKKIIPIYAEDLEILPDELAVILEVQNMDEPDFLTELLKYVKATVKPNTGRKLSAKKETIQDQEELRHKTMLNDALYKLEEMEFAEADKLLGQLLEEKYVNYQVYFGKLLAENSVRNQEELIRLCSKEKIDITKEKWYSEAEKIAGENERKELSDIVAEISDRIVRNEKRKIASGKYQKEYKKLDDELAYITGNASEKNKKVISEKEGQNLIFTGEAEAYLKRRKDFSERKAQLLSKENMKRPSWGMLLINFIVMFLPATVMAGYFCGFSGIRLDIPESLLIAAVIFIVGHSVVMLLKRHIKTIMATLLWTLIVTMGRTVFGGAAGFFIMEGTALLVPLMTVINNRKLAANIKAYKEECQQYTKDLEVFQKEVQDSLVPVYKERIRKLSQIAAESGMKSEERLMKEMEMLGRLEPLKQKIILELSIDR